MSVLCLLGNFMVILELMLGYFSTHFGGITWHARCPRCPLSQCARATPCHRQLALCRYQLSPSPSFAPLPISPWNCTNLTLNLQTFSSSRLCKLFSKTNSSNSHAATNRNLADPALGSRSLTVVMADRCDFAISISSPLAPLS